MKGEGNPALILRWLLLWTRDTGKSCSSFLSYSKRVEIKYEMYQ